MKHGIKIIEQILPTDETINISITNAYSVKEFFLNVWQNFLVFSVTLFV
jgi:hypothetical protein